MNLQKINYQKELEKLLTRLEKEEKVPTLLLHSCCAPCSSYVLEYLSQYFKITVFRLLMCASAPFELRTIWTNWTFYFTSACYIGIIFSR